MQCPLCKKNTMTYTDLLPNLSGLSCSACSGVWIGRSHYDTWRARQPSDLAENPAPVQIGVNETHKGKICPECAHLLLPYRVGHGLPFSIDYCGACGGVWLERNEWDAIKAKNLHDNLHEIVSAHWQNAVRQDDVQLAIEKTYIRLLGGSYDKAREMRAWLKDQAQRRLILAYLSDQKPEKV